MPEEFEIANFSHGYDDSVVEEESPSNSTQKCKNVDYTREVGAVTKDFGEKVMSSIGIDYPLDGAVQAIYEGSLWASGSGEWINKRLVVAGGTAYQYCPGGYFVPLGSGGEFLTGATDYVDVTHYLTYFVITDGTNAIYTWDGFNATLTALAGASGNYLSKHVEIFKDRIILGNTTEGGSKLESRIRWSNQGVGTTWTATDSLDVRDKTGDEIVRIKGLYENLIVFKKNTIHVIAWTGGALPFSRTTLDSQSMNNAGRTVAQVMGYLWFVNEEGIQMTNGTSEPEPAPADSKVSKLLNSLYLNSIGRCHAVSNDARQEYILTVPIEGSETCNYVIVYNWKYDKWRIEERDTNCIGFYTDAEGGTWASISEYYGYEIQGIDWSDSLLYPGSRDLVYGDEDGYCKQKSISYNNDGDAYDSYHETPWLDFGRPGEYKEVVQIQPTWKGIAGDIAQISYKKDYDADWTDCTTDDFAVTGASLLTLVMLERDGNSGLPITMQMSISHYIR